MTPSLAEPPTPQRFFSRPASSRRPSSPSGTPEIVVTALPRRPATSRRTFTRPPPRGGALALAAAGLRRRSPPELDHTRSASRSGTSAHPDEVHHEHERLVRADHPARPALAVGEVRRDRDAAPAADPHPLHALVPAPDHLPLPEAELEGVPSVPRRVELAPRLPRHAHVVHLDDPPGDRLLAVALHDVLDLELIGRRLVARDLHLRLLVHRHAPHGSHWRVEGRSWDAC